MMQKSNTNQQEEYFIENNEPVELTKVTLPPRWWFAQSSFGWLKGKNPRTLQLYKHNEKEKMTHCNHSVAQIIHIVLRTEICAAI